VLNEGQNDLLKEHINVFIGKSANMLSEMAYQRVLLKVPEIEVVDVKNMTRSNRPLFQHGHIVSSSMKFGDDFSGKAMLIFPAEKAKILVDSCMGEYDTSYSYNPEDIHLIDTDFDVLKEISNVILNSIIGEFSNLIGTKVDFSIPDVELIFVSEDEQQMYLKASVYMLIMYTSFFLEETQVEGAVVVALGMESLNMLMRKIDEILGEYDE